MPAVMECEPPLIRIPALEARLSKVSDPPLPAVNVTLLGVERTIVPTVIGASSDTLLDELGKVKKFAVTPGPFGTCAGADQLLAAFQVPPPANFQPEPRFGAPAMKALS